MSRNIIDLSGCKWQMERMRPGQGEKEGLNLLPAEYQGTHFSWNFAKVPGDVYTDLHRAGELEDPYFGRNMHKAKWVAEYEWWYCRRFGVDEDMKGKRVYLEFEGVDYSCEVWLNGTYLGSHEGMFSDFKFDITDCVSFADWRGGANMLMVKLNPPPKNYRNCGGKKVNFSGDYFSGLIPFGIWQPVKVVALAETHIESIRTDITVPKQDLANINATFEIDNVTNKTKNLKLVGYLSGKNCETETIKFEQDIELKSGINNIEYSLDVKNPKLWWSWDLGDQNLYDFRITLVENSKEIDELSEVIGLREITMEYNEGYTREETEFPWTFVINGKKQFLRSACWGGQPSFLYGQNSLKKYEDRLSMVKEANINNLRIFGWHPPEVPEFYRLCDELGITVWTNFTLATQAYPKDQEFIDGVLHECVATVKQRRNHPSLIFWMGGEEVFFSGAHEESGNKKLMEVIGETVAKHTNVPYGLASPLSSPSAINMGFKAHESEHANGHYYSGGGSFMEDYYPALDCAIIPELTAASAPSIKSLKKFIPEDELWPMGLSWAYHWADIDILINLNFEVFNEYKMGSLEEFVNATQIAQGTVIQFALETYRRRKPKMSGVALCHFITHVPDIKWGVVDFYGEKKLSFDYLKRTYQPVLPSLEVVKRRWDNDEEFQGKIWVLNDYYQEYKNLTLSWEVYDNKDINITGSKTVNLSENSAEKFEDIKFTMPKTAMDNFFVKLCLKDSDGNIVSENEYTLLVANQERAKQKSLEYRQKADAKKDKYDHGIYRYWDDMWEYE